MAALACSGAAEAAPSFTAEETVFFSRTSSMSVQSVVTVPGGFRMYVTSGPYRVLSATCTDQVAWGLESGIRLTTSVVANDVSSITYLSVVASTAVGGGWRMYYVGIDAGGLYRVLSATSTDGLAWGKEQGTRLQNNGGQGFIGSLSGFSVSNTERRLYYVADRDGLNNASRYAVFVATSGDGGLNFGPGTLALSANAYAVSATTMTSGKTRIYYTSPLTGSTTASQVLSATASDGLSFTSESDVRLSTTASVSGFRGLVVLRSTDSFRWRMYTDYIIGGTTETFISHALTRTPVVESFSPAAVDKGRTGVPYTLTGEIFSPTPTVSFVLGASTYNATTVVRADDTSLSGVFDTLNRYQGVYNVAVVNADGRPGFLSNALEIRLPPGSVTMLDNLFRPTKGGTTKATVELFEAGEVTARLYTVDGNLVATLFQGTMPAGQTQFTWNGRTPAGSVVASGVYLLNVVGPNLNTTERVVVVK
ncbi:hypothetical protein EPO15_06535 [bacterium]|nr:MAG: hypothetical protein EPO15_06535 [bacterium]